MSCKCHEGSGAGARSPEDAEKFDELDRYITSLLDGQTADRRRGLLIQILHRAQHLFGYLSEEVQKFVASRLKLSRAEIYGVISFYSYFTDQPVGRYKINVCTGTACFVKGAPKVLDEFNGAVKLAGIGGLCLEERNELRARLLGKMLERRDDRECALALGTV